MQYSNISLVSDEVTPYSTHVEGQYDHVKNSSPTSQSLDTDNPSHSVKPSDIIRGGNELNDGLSTGDSMSPGEREKAEAKRNAQNTLSVTLIHLLDHRQMRFKDIVEHIGNRIHVLTKNCGRHYSGAPERIISGALHASDAFRRISHDLWELNKDAADELENEIYTRCLEREHSRKRKRHNRPEVIAPGPSPPTPEQMLICLSRVLSELRAEQLKSKESVTSDINTFLFNEPTTAPLPIPDGTTPYNETIAEDRFAFLQQDPFNSISIQDREHTMKEKLGDEDFCFLMQFFNYFQSYLTKPAEMASKVTRPNALRELTHKTISEFEPNLITSDDIPDPTGYETKRRHDQSQPNRYPPEIPLNIGINTEALGTFTSIPAWSSVFPYSGTMISNMNQPM